MNKLCLLLATVLLVVGTAATNTNAQTVNLYFDEDFTQTTMDCPGAGQMGTLYVVAEDYNCWLTAFEFKVNLPPSMQHVADIFISPLVIGNTVSGVSIACPYPQNCYNPALIATIYFMWLCDDCSNVNELASVVEHPLTQFLGAVRWPDNSLIPASGGEAYVCRSILYYLDIKPLSCPNPFNVHLFAWVEGGMSKKGGVLPVAILGSPGFDVNDIDVSTILLEGVAPIEKMGGPHVKVEDVNTPPTNGGYCPCSKAGPDGIADLTMKFTSREIAAAITPGEPGETRVLTLTGTMTSGEPFAIQDCITLVGPKKEEPQIIIASEPLLNPVSPNPFNPIAQISYSVPEETHVRLVIYNIKGELIKILADEVVSSGEHIITWDSKDSSSGVYFCRFMAGEFSQTRKMILLK